MSVICNTPFCENKRNPNHAWCGEHRWDREKRKIKPYKELLPYWCPKRCDIHGYLNRHQVSINTKGSTYCRQCVNAKYDPEKNKKYFSRYKARQKNWSLQKRYKISADDFQSLMISQNSCCAICNIHISEHQANRDKEVNFAVDHCHQTGIVRGLLCYRCNMGLGYFKDNPELTQAATNYLTKN